ncbi:hypothetical protein [Amycolatopsis sulphurea]|uniref:hypothetical protein n=1 Tax=Amycolatopsis sulphurea TaxID=76022 RepID=UPI001FE836FC|nr:hypothetical protein [Amycolatopsis sulphurea]
MIAGKQLLEGGDLLGSLSSYYYGDLRNVCVLCAIGVFLISYRGYGFIDDIAGNVAGVAASASRCSRRVRLRRRRPRMRSASCRS